MQVFVFPFTLFLIILNHTSNITCFHPFQVVIPTLDFVSVDYMAILIRCILHGEIRMLVSLDNQTFSDVGNLLSFFKFFLEE